MQNVNNSELAKSAAKNASLTLFSQILYIFSNFACRTLFTYILGTEYLGLASMFSKILILLSFAELGIGTSIAYKLYKPLSEKNERLIIIYLNFFKRVYYVIVTVIAIVGLLLIPFLEYLIPNCLITYEIKIIFLLYLVDTIVSYLFVYKRPLLLADQKNYVVEIYTRVFEVLINIVQIVVLYYTHSFILYLAVKILIDLICNIVITHKINREYPYILSPIDGKLSCTEKKEFKMNLKGLAISKLTSVIFDGTDDYFINLYDGLLTIGILSNYFLICNTVNSLVNKVIASLTSAIGKISVEDNNSQTELLFKKVYFVNATVYGYIFVEFAILLRPLVTELWLDESFEVDSVILCVILIELSLRGMSYPLFAVRNALGYFYQYRWIVFCCALINILLDFVFGKQWGVVGIIGATIIARTITRMLDVIVVYKEYFQKSVIQYYKMHLKFLGFIGISFFLTYKICNLISFGSSIAVFIVKGIVISISYILVFLVFWGKTDLYLECRSDIMKLLKGRRNNR